MFIFARAGTNTIPRALTNNEFFFIINFSYHLNNICDYIISLAVVLSMS